MSRIYENIVYIQYRIPQNLLAEKLLDFPANLVCQNFGNMICRAFMTLSMYNCYFHFILFSISDLLRSLAAQMYNEDILFARISISLIQNGQIFVVGCAGSSGFEPNDMTLFIAFKRQNKINAMIRKFTTEDPNADAYPEISSNVYTFPVITNFMIG